MKVFEVPQGSNFIKLKEILDDSLEGTEFKLTDKLSFLKDVTTQEWGIVKAALKLCE